MTKVLPLAVRASALKAKGNKTMFSQSQQIIRQTLVELEELLTLLKR